MASESLAPPAAEAADGDGRHEHLCGECKTFEQCRREVGATLTDKACWDFLPWFW